MGSQISGLVSKKNTAFFTNGLVDWMIVYEMQSFSSVILFLSINVYIFLFFIFVMEVWNNSKLIFLTTFFMLLKTQYYIYM